MLPVAPSKMTSRWSASAERRIHKDEVARWRGGVVVTSGGVDSRPHHLTTPPSSGSQGVALMAERRSPFSDYLVYLAVRLVVCMIQSLPFEVACKFAEFLACVIYRID